MVKEDGHLFHIDFGHFLGNFKEKFGFKREKTPFVFLPEFQYVMGGPKHTHYRLFRELCCDAFNILRSNSHTLINLFQLVIPAGMPELTDERYTNYFYFYKYLFIFILIFIITLIIVILNI